MQFQWWSCREWLGFPRELLWLPLRVCSRSVFLVHQLATSVQIGCRSGTRTLFRWWEFLGEFLSRCSRFRWSQRLTAATAVRDSRSCNDASKYLGLLVYTRTVRGPGDPGAGVHTGALPMVAVVVLLHHLKERRNENLTSCSVSISLSTMLMSVIVHGDLVYEKSKGVSQSGSSLFCNPKDVQHLGINSYSGRSKFTSSADWPVLFWSQGTGIPVGRLRPWVFWQPVTTWQKN